MPLSAPDPRAPHLSSQPFGSLLESVASKTPTPGGGAVASAVGALSAALAGMVVSYSLGKKTLLEHQPALGQAARRLENARRLLLQLADEDAQAYGVVNELAKLPESDARRQREWPAAVRASVAVPMSVMAACADLLRLMESLAPITNRHLRSDLAIAAVLAEATARASRWNVLVNLVVLPAGPERERADRESDAMRRECVERGAAVERACV